MDSPTTPTAEESLLRPAVEAYRRGDLAAAESAARAATTARPDSVEAWNLLGVVLRTGGSPRAAIDAYRRALDITPDHAGAWTNLGNACKDMGRIDTAIACQGKAVTLRPDAPEMHHNLGIALMAARRHEEAVAAYSRALLFDPTLAEVRWDRALAQLACGRWAEAWTDYGARIGGPGLPARELPGRAWKGQNLPGATLLVASEQGMGDAIWCWRYLRAARARVGRLVLECRPELVSLARAQGIADAVIARGEALPEATEHCYQCSLPGIFTARPEAIPPTPYLRAPACPPSLAAALGQAPPGRLRVGIIWSGSPTFKTNAERSARLARFVDGFALPRVSLFSLQMGPQRQDLADLGEGAAVIDLAPHLSSFADTAAAVSALDLVIMTDSAVAHLCGALGRPVWLLLPFNAYWLWGTGERTPWYDSVRLFHQPSRGDWTGAFDAAEAALLALVAGKAGADQRLG